MASIEEAIRRLRYIFTSEGADKLASDLDKVEKSTEQTEKASLSLEKQFGNLERRYNTTLRAQQDYEKVQRQVNAAVSQNPALLERGNQVLALAAQHYGQAGAMAKAFAAATSGVSGQLIALSAGAGPVGTFLAALGPWGLAAAAGLGAASKTLNMMSEAAHDLAQKSDELRKFSEVTELTTNQIQALRSVAADKGVAGDDAQSAIQQFTARFDALRKGEGDLLTQVRRVNPALADQMAVATDAASALTLLGTALTGVDNVFQRNALVKAATGKGGLSTVNFLTGLDVGQVTQGYVDAGKALDENLIKKLSQLEIEIAKTSAKAKENIASVFSEDTLRLQLRYEQSWLSFSESVKNFSLSGDLRYLLETVAKIEIGGEGTLLGRLGINYKAAYKVPGSGDEAAAFAGQISHGIPLPQGRPQAADPRYIANQLKDQIAAMGDAATAAQRLDLAQKQLAISGKDAGLTAQQQATASRILNENYASNALSSRIALLGELATADEAVLQKQYAINKANRDGAGITLEEAAAIKEKTRLLAEYSKLPNTLAFERAQIGRTDIEATVASRLRSEGKPIDFSSATAEAIRFNEQLKQTKDLTTDFVTGFAGEFRNQLRQGVSAWQAFGNAGLSALTRLQDKLTDMALSNVVAKAFGTSSGGFNLFSLFGGGSSGTSLGGSAGAVPAPTAHSGGVVGALTASRYVHPAYFDDAPRMHGGGNIDWAAGERPIIGLTGERMLNRQEAANYGKPITVQPHVVINNYGADVQQHTNEDGDLELTVRALTRDEMASGRTNMIGRQKYGQTPRLKQRG